MWPAEPWDHDGNDEGPVVPEPRVVGADPWEPFICPRCGSVNTAGMPEKCDGCGLRNYGVER